MYKIHARLDRIEGLLSEATYRATTFCGQPSRVLLLTNMVKPDEVDANLLRVINEGCSEYGKVTKVTYKVARPGLEEETVRIFVQFAEEAAAREAYIGLDGRFFNSRTVRVCFFPEDTFDANRLEPSSKPK